MTTDYLDCLMQNVDGTPRYEMKPAREIGLYGSPPINAEMLAAMRDFHIVTRRMLDHMSTIDGKDAKTRKNHPITTGCLDYFPDALLALAECSKIGNDQHNPGQPLHWAKDKSNDHADCLLRHLIDRGKIDSDRVRHSTKVLWRAAALLQTEIEAEARVLKEISKPEFLREDNIWYTDSRKPNSDRRTYPFDPALKLGRWADGDEERRKGSRHAADDVGFTSRRAADQK